MDIKTIMARLGHPKHADLVYTTLSKSIDPLSVSAIAERADISRVVVYRCVASLSRDALVAATVRGKRTLYSATGSEALADAMQLTTTTAAFTAAKHRTAREKDMPAHIRFLRGNEGIREAFDDVVTHTPKRGTVFRYTSEQSVDEVNAYLAPDYRKRRDAKRLERLVISNPLTKAQKRSRLERFIRTIPEDADIFDQNVIQLVYGERVSFIDITNKQVTIIENKALADFQKVIFKQLYKRLDRNS